MFLPLNDEAALHHRFTPWGAWGAIALCVTIFVLFQAGLVFDLEPRLSLGFGLIPQVFAGQADLAREITAAPTLLTPLTSLFLHGNFMHLIGNMLFIWIFADNVEEAMGTPAFVTFYLAAGAAAGIAYALMDTSSPSPLIGASGAVSAVLGAYLVLYPQVKVFGLAFKVIPFRVPAFWFIGAWFVLQVGHALFDPNRSVAWVAHIAGLIIGALAVVALRIRPQYGPKAQQASRHQAR